MPHPRTLPRPRRRPPAAVLLALALLLVAVGAPQVLAAKSSKRVAASTENATLGKTVLTTTKGRTLYSLSVEKNGKFICTASCLSVWHPLMVPAGVRPTGPVKLGTVIRPEGGTQVTYKGRPLYFYRNEGRRQIFCQNVLSFGGRWLVVRPSGRLVR